MLEIAKKLFTEIDVRLMVDAKLTPSLHNSSGGRKLASTLFGLDAAILLCCFLKTSNTHSVYGPYSATTVISLISKVKGSQIIL